ncbi:MAG: glutamate-cysteine ligase family protein [Candidatus Hodarchaeota archaeon]
MTIKDYSLKTKLYFTHGIEIENHLVSRKTGEVLVGDELLNAWEKMFSGAADFINKLKKDKHAPKEILKKIEKVEVKEEIKRERRLKFIFVNYKLGKKTIRVNAFGPDPNIGQITWLLELVTPPCEYLEELDWWINTLFAAGLQGLPPDVALLPIGLNPTEKRVRSGLTCGEHHHIGMPIEIRIPIYNMLRNYVPHLIALSTTSPFLDQKPSGKVLIRKSNGKEQIIGRCVHSYRLLKNSGQMGPNIPTYLPVLDNKSTRKDFANSVRKAPPDDRMVDLYPFTDYSTIEIRFFDAQPWPEIRLAIVLLIQALAQKTRNMIDNNEEIPKVSSQSLYENRRKSVNFGLLAQFTTDDGLADAFSKFYNYDITTGNKASKLMHSIKSLLVFVQSELEGFGSNLVNYVLLPILGSNEYDPPLTVAEYLLSLYKTSGENISFLPTLYYSKENSYPLIVDGDFNSLQQVEIKDRTEIEATESALQQSLRKDLAKRKISIPKVAKKPPKPKKKPPKKKVPRKIPEKMKVEKPIVTPTIKVEKPPVLAKTTRRAAKVKKPVPKPAPPPVEKPIEIVEEEIKISAFEESEDLEVFSPTIEVEAKYQKIESRIANVMRTRRKEIEVKRREFFIEHLKKERVAFKPSPKKVSAIFPSLVSGSEVFGYIELSFRDIKRVMYKFRNNPITLIFKAKEKDKPVESKINTTIDIASLEERGMTRIPCSINLGELYGEITVKVEAITATNESLLPKKFSFSLIRKDEIAINPKEFYITGNYGLVECIFQAVNESKDSEKGELEVYLVTQSLSDPVPIYYTKFNLKPNENLELARSIDLLINYQHSPFYVVSQTTIGRFKKNRSFKTIGPIQPLREICVDWNFSVDPTKRINLWEGVEPRKQYEVNFVFHFIKSMPYSTIAINVNTLPGGQTKRLANFRIKRDVDAGDEFVVPNIKFKTPKDCGYLYFDVEIRNEMGLIPIDLISDPIGVQSKGVQASTFEERLDLTL